jgi:uncharacterized membrane protein YcjF (UPF0283 family)
MAEVKKKGLFKSVIENYDPRVIKNRFNRIKMSPYKSIKFQYQASFVVIIVLCIVIVWQLVTLILHYPGANDWTSLLGRGAIIVVGIMIVIKAFGVLTPLKKVLDHYEKAPTTQGIAHTKTINIADEVDSILAKYDKDKKPEVKK